MREKKKPVVSISSTFQLTVLHKFGFGNSLCQAKSPTGCVVSGSVDVATLMMDLVFGSVRLGVGRPKILEAVCVTML